MMTSLNRPGIPSIVGKPRGQMAAAAVSNMEEYIRKRLEDAKVPELEPNEAIVMRQASKELQDGIILSKLRAVMGAEFTAARRLEIVSPELTEQQLDVLMDAVPGLNRDEARKAVSKVLKEKLPDPCSVENASRVQEWSLEAAVTTQGTPVGSGQSSPVSQFVKPEVTTRSAAVELAVQKVKKAEEEVCSARAMLEVAVAHPLSQTAELIQNVAVEALQEAMDVSADRVDALAARFPGFPVNSSMAEADAWRRQAKQDMSVHDRKDLDGLHRELRTALRDQERRTYDAQQAREEYEVQQQLHQDKIRELEEQWVRTIEELFKAKRELDMMERQARETQTVDSPVSQGLPRAASTGLLKQLHEVKASKLKRRAYVQDGSSEMLLFLPIKKLLLLYKVAVGLPSSKKEVQDMLAVKQGRGLGVPDAETLSAYVYRFMKAHRMAAMYGIYSDARLGLLPGLKNSELRTHATSEFVREPRKYEDTKEVVNMLEKAAIQFQLMEETRPKPSCPRHHETRVTVNVSDHATSSASTSAQIVTRVSGAGATDGDSNNTKQGEKTLKADWKQGPHPCSRCNAWHDEAVQCRPTCALCNRRHEPGKPCWQKCGDCGRYHPKGDCRGTEWKGGDRGRGDGGTGAGRKSDGAAYVAEEWAATPEEMEMLFAGMPEYPADSFEGDWEQGSIFVVEDQAGAVIDSDTPKATSAIGFLQVQRKVDTVLLSILLVVWVVALLAVWVRSTGQSSSRRTSEERPQDSDDEDSSGGDNAGKGKWHEYVKDGVAYHIYVDESATDSGSSSMPSLLADADEQNLMSATPRRNRKLRAVNQCQNWRRIVA